jgi:hypothetical protein
MPAKDVTVTAHWTYTGTDDDDDEDYDDDSGDGTPPTPAYQAGIKPEGGTETAVPVTVDENAGIASADIGPQSFQQQGDVDITMPSISGVDTYSVGIPVPDLSEDTAQRTFTVNTAEGNILISSNMLAGVADAEGNKAQIAIGRGDKSTLPEEVRESIGDRPLIQLTLSIDGRQTDWSNPDAPVTVSIPYTPTEEELADPDSIVVWYIDGSGNIIPVPSGRYNPDTGMVTFTVTHFSHYAVSYKQVAFSDVPEDAWYAKAVSFVAARDITKGTGGGMYSPDGKLTRAQFIAMLMRAYGIAPDTDADPADNFADAGDTWYTGYLAAAKRLRLSTGVGKNKFAPDREITRQEAFTLLYNILGFIGQLPQDDTGRRLSDFGDAGLIAPWAEDAMGILVRAGVIQGSGGKLRPAGTIARAEMAQVLYNLLSK